MSEKVYIHSVGIETGTASVSIWQRWNGRVIAGVHITDRSVARDLGTFILQCTGNPSLWTNEDYVVRGGGTVGELRFAAEDGAPLFTVDGATSPVRLPEDDAIDLAQRLIVWAGVK